MQPRFHPWLIPIERQLQALNLVINSAIILPPKNVFRLAESLSSKAATITCVGCRNTIYIERILVRVVRYWEIQTQFSIKHDSANQNKNRVGTICFRIIRIEHHSLCSVLGRLISLTTELLSLPDDSLATCCQVGNQRQHVSYHLELRPMFLINSRLMFLLQDKSGVSKPIALLFKVTNCEETC